MAKLQTPSKNGFNAGDSYNVKYIQIDKIVIDPEIAGLFNLSEKAVDKISQNIIREGFHKEEPVTIWEDIISGKNILLDGHQRYAAAKKAGEVEIPYVEKHFDCRDDAILYTFQRQVIRRNLTGAEMLTAAKMLPNKKSKNGEGRAVKEWAEYLGISFSTMYQAKSVLKNASEEELQAIRDNKTSIKKVYRKNNKQPQEIKFTKNDSQGLPSNVSFLNSAVILLIEAGLKPAAELLVNHFLRKNEKRGFYDLLPEAISAQLPRLPLVVRDD